MKLSSITVKKSYLEKITTKDASGGFNSNENSAEVTMTFEGMDINEHEANDRVREATRDLLDDDAEWLRKDRPKQEKLA